MDRGGDNKGLLGSIFDKATLAFVLCLSIPACTQDNPSEEDGRKYLQQKIQEYVNDSLKNGNFKEKEIPFILNFQKIDGVEREYRGQKIYTMHFDAEIDFPKGFGRNCVPGGFLNSAGCSIRIGRGWSGSINIKASNQRIKYSLKDRRINFYKTEKGWKKELCLSGELTCEK